MKLHPRESIVSKARSKFGEQFIALEQEFNLTYGEIYGLLAEMMLQINRSMLRQERHPDDPSKPSGLE